MQTSIPLPRGGSKTEQEQKRLAQLLEQQLRNLPLHELALLAFSVGLADRSLPPNPTEDPQFIRELARRLAMRTVVDDSVREGPGIHASVAKGMSDEDLARHSLAIGLNYAYAFQQLVNNGVDPQRAQDILLYKIKPEQMSNKEREIFQDYEEQRGNIATAFRAMMRATTPEQKEKSTQEYRTALDSLAQMRRAQIVPQQPQEEEQQPQPQRLQWKEEVYNGDLQQHPSPVTEGNVQDLQDFGGRFRRVVVQQLGTDPQPGYTQWAVTVDGQPLTVALPPDVQMRVVDVPDKNDPSQTVKEVLFTRGEGLFWSDQQDRIMFLRREENGTLTVGGLDAAKRQVVQNGILDMSVYTQPPQQTPPERQQAPPPEVSEEARNRVKGIVEEIRKARRGDLQLSIGGRSSIPSAQDIETLLREQSRTISFDVDVNYGDLVDKNGQVRRRPLSSQARALKEIAEKYNGSGVSITLSPSETLYRGRRKTTVTITVGEVSRVDQQAQPNAQPREDVSTPMP